MSDPTTDRERAPGPDSAPVAGAPAAGAARARRHVRPVPGRRLPAALLMARMAALSARRTALSIADSPHAGSVDEIRRRKQSLLVTFRRDGTPVPTPAWAAEANGTLYVRVERGSGKVKRLQRDARMLIAPCTFGGKPLGAPLEAHGRVLEREEELGAESALASRYGFGRVLFELTADVMRVDMCYLEITPGAWRESEAS